MIALLEIKAFRWRPSKMLSSVSVGYDGGLKRSCAVSLRCFAPSNGH